MHFPFISYQSDQSFLRCGQNSVWPWKNTSEIFKEICQNNMMSGSHFLAQTSKFMLIYATAVTLGQGYRKIIQYISPNPYNLCAKYLRFSWNILDVRGKSCCCIGRGVGRRGRNELKTQSHPRPRWLKDTIKLVWCQSHKFWNPCTAKVMEILNWKEYIWNWIWI